jgi:hypothetical protein
MQQQDPVTARVKQEPIVVVTTHALCAQEIHSFKHQLETVFRAQRGKFQFLDNQHAVALKVSTGAPKVKHAFPAQRITTAMVLHLSAPIAPSTLYQTKVPGIVKHVNLDNTGNSIPVRSAMTRIKLVTESSVCLNQR